MSTVRLRRLNADYVKLKDYVRRHPRVRLIQTDGDPPERYQLEYRLSSLRMVNGALEPIESHLVEVTLPRNYPRTPPQCRMLSPIFHPNIAPHAICVGDHWSAGESLESIIMRIGEMIAYQSYNVKSPLNGDAARWVEENKHRVPLDRVSLLAEEEDGPSQREAAAAAPRTGLTSPPSAPAATAGHAAPVSPAAEAAPPLTAVCPSCATAYRIAARFAGRRIRCQKCGENFQVAGQTPEPAAAQPVSPAAPEHASE